MDPKIVPARAACIGDVHGGHGVARALVRAAASRGVGDVFFLGDWGFLWSGPAGDALRLNALQAELEKSEVTAWVVGGNHENYDLWATVDGGAYERGDIAQVRPNIFLLPRVWHARTEAGTRVAALGGANSIDRYQRAEGLSWWAQESITPEQLAELGTDQVDVLLGHDCPQSDKLIERLATTAQHWAPRGLAYSRQGQQMFQQAVERVRPRLSLGGHYHQFIDTTQTFKSHTGEPFTCRCVTLSYNGRYPSLAIVDFDTLEVELCATG